MQHCAQHPAVEGFALVRGCRIAHTHDPADVEHLNHVAGLELLGHVADVYKRQFLVLTALV